MVINGLVKEDANPTEHEAGQANLIRFGSIIQRCLTPMVDLVISCRLQLLCEAK